MLVEWINDLDEGLFLKWRVRGCEEQGQEGGATVVS